MMRKLIAACACVVGLMSPAWAEIKIQDVTSPGGIKAWLVQDQDIPFAALEIRFRGGTSLDSADKAGATYFMTGLIEEGAGDLNSQQFAEKLEELAASFSFTVSKDTLSISAQFLSENRDEAIDLLTLALNNPRFDQDAIDRVRAQILSGIRSDEKEPKSIAGQSLAKSAFAGHAYEIPRQGTAETVSAITRDDLVAAHQNALSLDHLVVAAAGDLTPEQLGKILDQLFGTLPKTGPALPETAQWQQKPGVTVIDFPSPQTAVLFAQPGIAQNDPDFFPAFILNEVLGGGRFSARLMTEVREKRGLTYGVGTSLVDMDHSAYLLGSFAASNDKVGQAVEVIQEQLKALGQDGITEEELEKAKTYLIGAYPLRFDGNSQIASILAGMQLSNLPIDYISGRNDKVSAVTLDDVKRVAKQLFDPDKMHYILVGQPENIAQ